MTEKRYYRLKLKRDFFKRHDIQIIEDMENGKDYILFYLKLLCESVDHEGNLRFSETIPYNEKMLSTITNTNIDIVRNAMKVFTGLNMIEVLDDDTIFMTECNKMLGSETYWAERKRIQRENQVKIGQCPADVQDVQVMSKQEIDIDLEKKLELERKNKKEKKRKQIEISPEDFDFTEKVKAMIYTWLGYKKEKGQTYKPTGLKTLLNNLLKWQKEFGEDYVVRAIDNSMQCNYAGIFPARTNNNKKTNFETRNYSKEELYEVYDSLDDVDI